MEAEIVLVHSSSTGALAGSDFGESTNLYEIFEEDITEHHPISSQDESDCGVEPMEYLTSGLNARSGKRQTDEVGSSGL